MSEIKLKPCPFCGGEAELVRQHSGVSDKIYIVSCKNEECEASLGHFCESKEMAITEWNTRKPMERILEKLTEEVTLERMNKMEDRVGKRQTTGFCLGVNASINIVKEEGGIE